MKSKSHISSYFSALNKDPSTQLSTVLVDNYPQRTVPLGSRGCQSFFMQICLVDRKINERIFLSILLLTAFFRIDNIRVFHMIPF